MKSSLTHVIGAIVMCGITLAGYGIWYATIAAKSAAVAAIQTQVDTKTATVNRIAATRATLAGIAGDEAAVQGYFVPETRVVAFIDALEAQGKASGAAVSVLSVSASAASAQPSLAFSIVIKGTFNAVMRAVGSIEYAPYAVSVSALSIEQDDKNNWHADLKLLVGSVSAARTPASPSALAPFPHAYF